MRGRYEHSYVQPCEEHTEHSCMQEERKGQGGERLASVSQQYLVLYIQWCNGSRRDRKVYYKTTTNGGKRWSSNTTLRQNSIFSLYLTLLCLLYFLFQPGGGWTVVMQRDREVGFVGCMIFNLHLWPRLGCGPATLAECERIYLSKFERFILRLWYAPSLCTCALRGVGRCRRSRSRSRSHYQDFQVARRQPRLRRRL